jgi:hypothetical protein
MLEQETTNVYSSPTRPIPISLGIEPLFVFFLLPLHGAFWVSALVVVVNSITEVRCNMPKTFCRKFIVLLLWSLWNILFVGVGFAVTTPYLVVKIDGTLVDWIKVVLLIKLLAISWICLLVWRLQALVADRLVR